MHFDPLHVEKIDVGRTAIDVGAEIERRVVDIDRDRRCESQIGGQPAQSDVGFSRPDRREGQTRRIADEAFGIANGKPIERVGAKGGHRLRDVLQAAFAALRRHDNIAAVAGTLGPRLLGGRRHRNRCARKQRYHHYPLGHHNPLDLVDYVSGRSNCGRHFLYCGCRLPVSQRDQAAITVVRPRPFCFTPSA